MYLVGKFTVISISSCNNKWRQVIPFQCPYYTLHQAKYTFQNWDICRINKVSRQMEPLLLRNKILCCRPSFLLFKTGPKEESYYSWAYVQDTFGICIFYLKINKPRTIFYLIYCKTIIRKEITFFHKFWKIIFENEF